MKCEVGMWQLLISLELRKSLTLSSHIFQKDPKFVELTVLLLFERFYQCSLEISIVSSDYASHPDQFFMKTQIMPKPCVIVKSRGTSCAQRNNENTAISLLSSVLYVIIAHAMQCWMFPLRISFNNWCTYWINAKWRTWIVSTGNCFGGREFQWISFNCSNWSTSWIHEEFGIVSTANGMEEYSSGSASRLKQILEH